MSTSIYDIGIWASGSTYLKWDIVKHLDSTLNKYLFWHSTLNANQGNTPSTSSSQWDGNVVFGGQTRPEFFWVPSYSPSYPVTPRVFPLKFGDGYEQRPSDGINIDLLTLNLSFDDRQAAEMTSIIHFLHERKAREAFVFVPSTPYPKAKLFVCRSWDTVQQFFDRFTVRAIFEEVPA